MSGRTKGDDTRARILSAALDCFREKGFDATTMRDVAARAGMALGAAYYYFPAKDAIVLAFYKQAQEDLAPRMQEVLASTKDLRGRLKQVVLLKLEYFAESRRLLGALAAHTDPAHPLSPFGEESREVRERDIAFFEKALQGQTVKKDLASRLPGMLWMFQMGIVLFWIYDRSLDQRRTHLLLEKSLNLIYRLLQVSGLPLMSPMRRLILEVVDAVTAEEPKRSSA
jgi:AcrR family transcriptional regulator